MTTPATFRFGTCELDEARRTLSAGGREIRLQPLVFDLLCYLVRHRERVVSKDELLDALWPGTVVVDNALQRVVSLARAALAQAGIDDAVRTYARHGYRFCVDGTTDLPRAEEPDGSPDVAEALRACDRQDWAAACEAFAAADAQTPLPPERIEQWGRAAICAGIGPSAAPALERVAAQCEARGDALGAVRAILPLVQIRIDNKQGVLASGLLQRAARCLDGHGDVVERGHYAWMASRFALGSGDKEAALALADEACRIGRALRDPDVECLGLVYRGHAVVARGDVAGGVAHHEESAALIRLGGVKSWVAGWALCGILYTARYRCDWVRAAQFAEAFADWSRSCTMPAFPGTCQLHRAAVLGVRGDLVQAAEQVREAAALIARVSPWAEGDAYCVLGDIQVHHGDFEQAEASYRQAHALGWDPQPGLARLHLLTGRPELALQGVERALEASDWTLRERRGQLLCMLAHAALATGDAERARQALRMLDTDAGLLQTEALQGLHCNAVAELALHDADHRLAARKLREAVGHWREIGSPLFETESRLRLAECLLLQGDAGGADLELHAIGARAGSRFAVYRHRVEALGERLAALRDAEQISRRN